MKKKTPSDGILVFDRYYGRKPSAALLLAMRVLFCAAFSACGMLFVFSQYSFRTISLGYVGFVSAVSAVIMSLLFIAFRRRYAIPAIFLFAGAVCYFRREVIFERLSYFADECMLLAEGRFIAPGDYLINNTEQLSVFNPDYCDGMALGTFLLCAAFSMLCAATMKRRIRVVPAVAVFLLLCVPRFLSEDIEFNRLFVPVALLTAAGAAIALNYTEGLAVVRSGASVYRAQLRDEESGFVARSEKAGFLKRISMQICYYSKYATSGAYCAAVFAALLLVSASVFGQGEAFDYTAFFDYIESIGEDDTDLTINEDKVSDYFTGTDDKEQELSISSPGRGNKSVISVEFTGERPIYLRGDIGVEFTGTGWITPINDDKEWKESDFSEYYRPAELRILSLLLSELSDEDLVVASESDITIDYLTETDVVFLPAYTGDYSFYDSSDFDVYGDYCVRVSDDAGSYINSVRCTALVNEFSINGISDADRTIQLAFEILDDYNISVSDLYSSVVMDTERYDDVIAEYTRYISDRYLDVPRDIGAQLSDFMWESGLSAAISDFYYLENTALFRYKAAEAIDEYLKTNYTYSLSNTNRGEGAVIKFLTETRQGHCSLYASAMTLMLRELGIPARYCTGFAVHPETIDGNSKVFKEKDLHAWVEVYLDEFGWVTFDPTSAAVNALAAAEAEDPAVTTAHTTRPSRSDDTAESDEPSIQTEEPDNTAATDETEQPTEIVTDETTGPSPSKPIPAGLIVGILAVAVVLLIITVIVWHLHTLRVRADAEVAAASRRRSTDVYNCIIDILDLHKLTPGMGELPVAFYERADKLFNAGLTANAQLLEAAAFADAESDAVDVNRLSEILGYLYSAALKRGGYVTRYRIRRVVLSRLTKRS